MPALSLRAPQTAVHIYHRSALQHSPKPPLSKFFLLHLRDTLTRNGLRCFPAPVNRLPACEGIDGFDIGCCLTQKRRHGPGDGPFLTLHIHHVGQSNEWDAGLPRGSAGRKGARGCKGSERRRGCQISPMHVGEGNNSPPTTFSPLSVFNL